jgi:hypothetical protein
MPPLDALYADLKVPAFSPAGSNEVECVVGV